MASHTLHQSFPFFFTYIPPNIWVPPTFPAPVVIYYFNCVVAENAFCALHFIADSVCFYPLQLLLPSPTPVPHSRWGVKSVSHTNTRMFVAARPCLVCTLCSTYELKYKYTSFLWGLLNHMRLFAIGAFSARKTERKILYLNKFIVDRKSKLLLI